ncbi:hypothetical protein EMCG_03214 [[Emmonsia] crescens]|uniref:Rad21/Rec8-like protein N-terminal domain-containing protein n=1 Tax=[Emmonsia] crescens TaxID=73230 RepID=A0A0G2HVZ0_9EURO|nr:hypothetical protein EMCG_03214 [Emmonsia crescens UAMH 3008]
MALRRFVVTKILYYVPRFGRLVATLGAKSTTKKVNRKAILDVDVSKACETIIHPEAPMALRLQGNLLYGVSRVYHQQCGYALMDAQTMRDRMRTMLKEIRSTGLDPDAGKAKPDQLVLPDDPSFIPDLMLPGLNVDLSALDISSDIGSPRKSSLLSSFLTPSSKSSRFSDGQLHLNISSSDIGGLGVGASGFPSDIGSSTRKETQFELPAAFAEETGVLLEPDFEFDGDGNIIELPVRPTPQNKPTAVSGRSATKVNSGLRPEEEGDFQAFQDQFEDQMVLHDDVEMRGDGGHGNFGSGDPASAFNSGADPNYEPVIEASSEAPEAQQRLRKRSVKTLGFDDPPELRNSDLAQWNSEYAQNMALATKLKQNNRLITLAKKNAASWVMGERICCDIGLGNSGFEHPLDMFSGEQMLATLTGNKISTTRCKRSRDVEEDVDSEGEARNVRMRGDGEDEIGRGDAIERNNGYDIAFDDIEEGRHAPPPMYDDGSSQMPWNITASIRGSQPGSSIHSRQFLPSVGGYSSIGGPRSIASGVGPDGSAMGGPSAAFGRRMGRMTSASPLAGRGMIGLSMSDIPITDDEEFDMGGNLGSNMDLDSSVAGCRDDADNCNRHHSSFEIYGPAAAVDTQTAAESQWLATTLDQESANFLDFVKSKIGEGGKNVKAPVDAGAEASGNNNDDGAHTTEVVDISFSAILPPIANSRIVATQALLHTLTLATKGALHVRQEKGIRYADGQEEFGEIFMWLV